MKTALMKVEQIDVMGSDLNVVNAARVSFHKESFLGYISDEGIWTKAEDGDLSSSDTKLINYLAKHNHWSPFAHCFMSFRIKAPIFVARQLVKHQVGLAWNEVSRRYVDEELEHFQLKWRWAPDKNKKQGSGSEVDEDTQKVADQLFWNLVAHSCDTYESFLRMGIAPEQARRATLVDSATEWIWSGSLMAFARVCKLRLDAHAQAETREIAAYIAGHCEVHFPISFKALMEN